MNIKIIFKVLVFSFFAYVYYTPARFSHFPWSPDVAFGHNIMPYFATFMALMAAHMIVETLAATLEGSGPIPHSYSSEGLAHIRKIGYSSIRVNGVPRFKATVFFNGKEREFDGLEEELQFRFKIGDKLVIRYHPDNDEKARVDLEASIKRLDSDSEEASAG